MQLFDPVRCGTDLMQAREENEEGINREEQQMEMMHLQMEYLDPANLVVTTPSRFHQILRR
jgi:hypothetical protein